MSRNFFESKKIQRLAFFSKIFETFYRCWYITKHSGKGDYYLRLSKNLKFCTDHLISLFSELFMELAQVILLLIVFNISI